MADSTWAEASAGFAAAISRPTDETEGDGDNRVDAKPEDGAEDDKVSDPAMDDKSVGDKEPGAGDPPESDGKDKGDQSTGEADKKLDDTKTEDDKADKADKADEADDSDEKGAPGSRAEKRIKQLLAARNKATSDLDVVKATNAQLQARLDAVEAKAQSTANAASSNSTGDPEVDKIMADLGIGAEDDTPAEIPAEVQAALDEQRTQLDTLLVQNEQVKLRAELDVADATYPKLPGLRKLLIHAVKQDSSTDIMRVAEDYAQYVGTIREADKAKGEVDDKVDAKADAKSKAPPRLGGKGTPLSAGKATKQKTQTWEDARKGFAEMIANG